MDDPRFDHLLGRLLDDSLSPDELVELAGLLRGHPERQQRLQDQLEAADWIAKPWTTSATAVGSSPPPLPAPRKTRSYRR